MAHLKPSLCQPNKNGIPPDRNPPTAIQGPLTIHHFLRYPPRAFLGRSKPRRHLRLGASSSFDLCFVKKGFQPFLHKTYLQCLSHFFLPHPPITPISIFTRHELCYQLSDYCNSLYFNLP